MKTFLKIMSLVKTIVLFFVFKQEKKKEIEK